MRRLCAAILQGLHESWLAAHAPQNGLHTAAPAATIEVRYRYNQDFKSIYVMVPSTIALLLVFIPAVLMAVGVVGEKASEARSQISTRHR